MAYTQFPIYPAGKIDPLLIGQTPLTPDMIREFPAERTFRFFNADTVADAAYVTVPLADPTVTVPHRYLVFNDQGRSGEPFVSFMIRLANDAALGSGNNIAYSFDGVNDAGIVVPGQIEDIRRRESAIFIRKTSANAAYRLWAY